MFNKLKTKPFYLLLLLLLFHLIGNLVWIKLNNAPPPWDQAAYTNFSLKFYQFFQSLSSGILDMKQFIYTFSQPYGPLISMLTGGVLFIFTPSIKLAQFTGTIFFLLTLTTVYCLGKIMLKNEWAALLAAFIFSFYQIIFDNSRWLLLDIPLTFFITTATYYLIKSNFFEERKYAIITFIALAFAVLTKFQAVIFFALPFIYSLILIIKNKSIQGMKNVLYGAVIFISMISIWLVFSLPNVINYFKIAMKAELLVDPTNLFDIVTWFHYLKLFIDYEISFLVFLFFLIFLYFYLKSKNNYNLFILLNIIFYYILFTIIPNKDMRYLFPILPYTAIIFAQGFSELYAKCPYFSRFILLSVITFDVIMYFSLSFGFPLEKGIRRQINLPYIKDIVYLNLTDYPVMKFDSRSWPHEIIVKDLYKESHGENLPIVFIPNYDNFNDNNFKMYLSLNRYDNIIIVRADGRIQFNTDEEVENFLDRFNYFLYTPDQVGVFYQIDKKAFEQMQVKIKKLLFSGQAEVLKEYRLPSGEKIELVKRL